MDEEEYRTANEQAARLAGYTKEAAANIAADAVKRLSIHDMKKTPTGQMQLTVWQLNEIQANVFGLGQRLEMPFDVFKDWSDRLVAVANEIQERLPS